MRHGDGFGVLTNIEAAICRLYIRWDTELSSCLKLNPPILHTAPEIPAFFPGAVPLVILIRIQLVAPVDPAVSLLPGIKLKLRHLIEATTLFDFILLVRHAFFLLEFHGIPVVDTPFAHNNPDAFFGKAYPGLFQLHVDLIAAMLRRGTYISIA